MNKKILAMALATALVLTVPVLATGEIILNNGGSSIGSGAYVPAGGGDPPIVKAKWEGVVHPGQESVIATSDDNPILPGTQVDPPMAWEKTVTLEYCNVITDKDGKGNIIESYSDVYHPDGSFKYEVPLTEVPTTTPTERLAASTLVQAAYDNGILAINTGYTLGEVKDELLEGSAKLFCGRADLDYHQMCGEFEWYQVCEGCPTTCVCHWEHNGGPAYEVDAFGVDVEGSGRIYFKNNFEYTCTAGVELDFNSIDWENVRAWSLDRIINTKWVEGDQVWDTPIGPACKGDVKTGIGCRPPTIRNIGNTPVYLGIAFDDMKFGKSGAKWNVDFDASMKHNEEVIMDPVSAHSGKCEYFDPVSTTMLPDKGLDPEPYCETENGVLDLCSKEKLTFSIHVYKAPSLDKQYQGCTLIDPIPMSYPWWKQSCTCNADCPGGYECIAGSCCVEE
jgi:hypothetical protein